MVCEHLRPLEQALLNAGIEETFRGQAWSQNCREWVYFDTVLNTASLKERYAMPGCVEIHENTDPKSGLEHGFVCTLCHDAIMGRADGFRLFE